MQVAWHCMHANCTWETTAATTNETLLSPQLWMSMHDAKRCQRAMSVQPAACSRRTHCFSEAHAYFSFTCRCDMVLHDKAWRRLQITRQAGQELLSRTFMMKAQPQFNSNAAPVHTASVTQPHAANTLACHTLYYLLIHHSIELHIYICSS